MAAYDQPVELGERLRRDLYTSHICTHRGEDSVRV